MLPLFFSGLLSYIVGMERRTSKSLLCKRDNSLSSFVISPDIRGLPFGYFFFFSKLYVTFILQLIAFIFGRDEEEDQCVTPLKSEVYILVNIFSKLTVTFIMSPHPPLPKGWGHPPTPTKGVGTYCFCDGSRWHQRWRKTSCLLCYLNTLWNILMILGRNVDQDEMTCCIQDWQLAFLLLELSPFVFIAPACSRVRYRRPIFCPSVRQHLCRRSTFMSKLVF